MAIQDTHFSTTSNQTVKLWSDRIATDLADDRGELGRLISSGVLKRVDELNKTSGDNVRYDLLASLKSGGFRGSTNIDGQSTDMEYFQDSLSIDMLRCAVNYPLEGSIDQQRILHYLPEDAYVRCREWWIDRFVTSAMFQLGGYYPTTITQDTVTYTGDDRLKIVGLNAATAPTAVTATRHIYAGSNTTDQGVAADTTATMTLALIQEAEVAAASARPYVLPLTNGKTKFRCYVTTKGFNQLINDTSAPNQARDIILAQITSGKDSNIIGDRFIWSQTEVIRMNGDHMPFGVNSSTGAAESNCRRAVFVGRDAGCIAFGKGYSAGGEATPGFSVTYGAVQNIGLHQEVSFNCIYGVKKTVYNSEDYGSIVISHYES
ncbi:MAG: hypothetical protein AMJ43_07990 [Coxiella sp. DG_40]|nr:MAG: hypothetical protein AMJ43_07990 [Coxiella sp. DG_40]